MMYYTHSALSLLLALLGAHYLNPTSPALFVTLVVLAGSLPDIDTASSHIGKKFPLLSRIINMLFGHRGFFHSVYVPIFLFAIFYYYFNLTIASGIAIGYLSHLLGDAMTTQGIMPFHPLHDLEIKGFFSTGGMFEVFVFILLSLIDIHLIVRW